MANVADKSQSAIPVVLGAMTFGDEGMEQVRVHTVAECGAIVDIFQAYGHGEVDTARFYGGGTSETMLAKLDWRRQRGLVLATKLFPTADRDIPMKGRDEPAGGWRHTPAHLDAALAISLRELGTDSVDLLYLHGPDRGTPYAETFAHLDALHKQGRFVRLGVSNFMAWEVAQICELCRAHGWLQPTVYQGVYNALHRVVEQELFSCLRYYGIAFYAFNPLGGGYLTSRYRRDDKDDAHEPGSRFDPRRGQGKMYRLRYWNEPYFDALDILRPAAKKHGLTEAECALRWLNHHSKLRRDKGDAIIIGASSAAQIQENLSNFEKGPLPDELVQALDAGAERVRAVSWKYFH